MFYSPRDQQGRQAYVGQAHGCRSKLLELIASLPPCHWYGSLFGRPSLGVCSWPAGHTVRLMAPKFVAPYRLSGQARQERRRGPAAICEAVQRPHVRFVPIKTVEQQATLRLWVRQGFIEQRTATINNRIQGLLSEFGIDAAAQNRHHPTGRPWLTWDLPGWANTVIGDLLSLK